MSRFIPHDMSSERDAYAEQCAHLRKHLDALLLARLFAAHAVHEPLAQHTESILCVEAASGHTRDALVWRCKIAQ